MIYTKYKFTPVDLANYIYIENLSHKRTLNVIKDLIINFNDQIVFPYRDDYIMFKREISSILNSWELDDDEADETEIIMNEVNGKFNKYKENYFDAYFKLIKLQLMYSTVYKKIKLKTLLKNFDYKRRTEKLMTDINRTLKALGLNTYLRDYELCDISDTDISLNDIIIIRMT